MDGDPCDPGKVRRVVYKDKPGPDEVAAPSRPPGVASSLSGAAHAVLPGGSSVRLKDGDVIVYGLVRVERAGVEVRRRLLDGAIREQERRIAAENKLERIREWAERVTAVLGKAGGD